MNPFRNSEGKMDSCYIINLLSDKDIITVEKDGHSIRGHWFNDHILDALYPSGRNVFGMWDASTLTFTI